MHRPHSCQCTGQTTQYKQTKNTRAYSTQQKVPWGTRHTHTMYQPNHWNYIRVMVSSRVIVSPLQQIIMAGEDHPHSHARADRRSGPASSEPVFQIKITMNSRSSFSLFCLFFVCCCHRWKIQIDTRPAPRVFRARARALSRVCAYRLE